MWQTEAHMNTRLFCCLHTNAALQSWNYVHLLESENVVRINMQKYHGKFSKFDFSWVFPIKVPSTSNKVHHFIDTFSSCLRQLHKTWRFGPATLKSFLWPDSELYRNVRMHVSDGVLSRRDNMSFEFRLFTAAVLLWASSLWPLLSGPHLGESRL